MGVVLTDIIENLKFVKKIMGFRKVLKDFEDGKDTYPISIQVQTQSSCNAKCVFCPYPYTSKITSQGKMEWATFKKIVDECVEFPNLTNFAPMLQNEPLLDKDICKAISYVKEKSKGRLIVHLSTNAYTIKDELLKDLMSSELDYLAISLNAFYKDTYSALLPGFEFERVMNNIEKIISYNHGKAIVSVRFLKTKQNEDEISKAVKYWHERGVRTEVITILHNRGGAIDVEDLKPKTLGKSLRESLRQRLFSTFSNCCVLPFRQMYILYNGDVILCGNDWLRNPILGNVNKDSLKDIWNGKTAIEIRRNMIQKQYEAIPPCRDCTMPEYFSSWR
ncbi:MAG: radical SAM protein [Nitrospinae bacterium]|nr:radical SAM protein [Nitrospinota bacterium]